MAILQYMSQELSDNFHGNEAVQSYLNKHNIHVAGIIEDNIESAVHWQERALGHWLVDEAKSGDELIVSNAASLAHSATDIFAIFELAAQKGVNIHFAEYDRAFVAKENMSTMFSLLSMIEADFAKQRTADAIARRHAAGLPLGRPKGRKNKALKLDKNREEIMKYLALGISKASIAKLVGCHSQTLYDWMERHGIEVKKEVGTSGRVQAKVVNKNLRNVFDEVM